MTAPRTVGATDESAPIDSAAARQMVTEHPLWYHTMDVAPGVTTPGWFDLRPIVDRLPWPDVRGRRCLDVGPYDGFLAFELERRGASEVVATDIADHREWDWPAHVRAEGPARLAAMAGPEKGLGFEIARRLLGSAVERVDVNVYELSRERIGEFDVVVCGSLLLHLRDPIGALEAIRGVCRERFVSAEAVDLRSSLEHPRRPIARLEGLGSRLQWWVPNARGHRRMLEAAGFQVERESGIYSIPFGPAHPMKRPGRPRGRAPRLPSAVARRLLTGNDGVPHQARLARRAV
jgi:tRNA (mo5U34)-methyltransferase